MDRQQFINIHSIDNIVSQSGIDRNPEVDTKLESLKGFIEINQLYNGGIKEIRTKLEVLDEEFRVKYAHNPIHHIESRLKAPVSIFQKLKKRGYEPTIENARKYLTDIAGVRVICNYIDDIYSIAGMLTAQNDINLIKKSDYILSPKPNGYRSLHLVLSVPVFLSDRVETVPVEIQIRTIAMDFWASLEHQLRYKTTKDVPDELFERLCICAEKSAELDMEMQHIYDMLKNLPQEEQCE